MLRRRYPSLTVEPPVSEPLIKQRIVLNTLRFLSNRLQISLVCLAVYDAREAIGGDVQLGRRFEQFALSRWAANEQFEILIALILRNPPLRQPSVLTAKSLRRMLQIRPRPRSRLSGCRVKSSKPCVNLRWPAARHRPRSACLPARHTSPCSFATGRACFFCLGVQSSGMSKDISLLPWPNSSGKWSASGQRPVWRPPNGAVLNLVGR